MKKKMVEKTFLDFEYVSDPRYSHDGKYIAYVSQKADYEANGYRGDLYLIENGVQRRLTARGDAKSFCWTPQNTILFPARRERAHRQADEAGIMISPFYEISPDGGEARPAFDLPLENASQLTWVRDELYTVIAEYRVNPVADGAERLALRRKEQVYHTFDELPFFKSDPGIQNGKRNRLYLFDRRTGELTPISGEDESVTRASNNGDTVLYSAAGYTNQIRNEDVDLYTYEIDKKKLTKVMDKSRLMVRNCEVFGELWGDKVIVFGSEGEKYGRTESPSAWLIDRETGEMSLFCTIEYNVAYRNITSDHKLCGGMMKVVGDRVYFTNTVNYDTYVRYFDREGNWSAPLTRGGSVDSFDVFEGKLCTCAFHEDKLPEIYEDGVQLSHMNDKLLSEHNIVTPEHFTFVNKDGVEIDGWIMKPVGYEPGKEYPAVLHIHGGPRCAFGSIFVHEHQMWVNDGYFVFFCNPRGSEGKGDDFADIWGKMGTIDYEDLMEFTDRALERCPDVNPKRVGVLGGSYGGFMTNWVIGHTGRFAAAASQRSISNWISYEHATSSGIHWVKNFLHHQTKENAEALWNASPLKYAHLCTTPTLFIHSDNDNVCWMDQGIQMYTGVKLAGVPSKLCLFKGEGHELSRSGRPQPRLARMEEIHAWMDRYLK